LLITNRGVIFISRTKFTSRKHWLVLITLLLGLSIPLIGCSSSPTTNTNSSTPTIAAATTHPSAVTTPSVDSTATSLDSNTTPPSDSNTTPPSTGQNVSQSGKTTTPTKVVGKANTAISKIEYNKLQYGSTYEKVKALLGGTGEVLTESGTKGNKGYTVTYHLKSSASGEVFLAFKDNILVNKMEVNLQ